MAWALHLWVCVYQLFVFPFILSLTHTHFHNALVRLVVPYLCLEFSVMSFPNSGTSFTLELVAAASNMSMATNYGWEQAGAVIYNDNTNNISSNSTENSTGPIGISVPIFPTDTPAKGPFWIQPLEKHPRVAVLTKTHCGGYCHDCRPYKSVETPHSFMMHCAMSEVQRIKTIVRSTNSTNGTASNGTDGEITGVEEEEVVTEHHVYDYNYIDRAVHLFRDPMDNMVSRYHLGVHKVVKENRTELVERYTYNAEGFSNFCWDKTYFHEERSESHIDQDVLQLIYDVPCHMDLFRYIQWHNLAFIVTDDYLNLPTHIVHYEDYSSNMEGTLQLLLDFLELPNTGAEYPFQSGKSYRDYFTEDQIARMRTATMMLASPLTWYHLERYF